MYIKSITIDGFKSYGKRVELTEFDKQFNAITGLNGSGKSNILDSICFVLGSCNMSLARVSNLRELIYKSGQAGVIKASVAITFDNTDKENCPPSYENYPEIVVRREVNLQSRSKYYINGFAAQGNQVTDLFHAVQLNINNPHFLIMQGRITKVLNMKPQEILAMVEEATGASRYELKKKTSQTAIERKETALKTIDSLLHETIIPNLEKLKKEQSGLKEYQALTAELDHQEKVFIAHSYVTNLEVAEETGNKVEERKGTLKAHVEVIRSLEESIVQIGSEISRLEKEKDDEFGGKLSKLESDLQECEREETRAQTALNNRRENLKDGEKRMKELKRALSDEERVVERKKRTREELMESFHSLDERHQETVAEYEAAQRDLEAISSGASRAEKTGDATTLADQLISCKKDLSELETKKKRSEMTLSSVTGELEKKRKEVDRRRGSQDSDTLTLISLQSEVDQLAADMAATMFDESNYAALRNERKNLVHECTVLSDEIDSFEHRHHIKFDYRNPGSGFDDRKVYGPVCSLIKVKDPSTATALEKAAKSKLFNVVVKDQDTAQLLLDRGNLQRQTTFLPLDRIQGRTIETGKLRAAEDLVGENVRTALSLVQYDPDLSEAIKFVFSDTLICTDEEVAKKVAFDRNVRTKCVTLDGDIYDPAGTLTGGSRGDESNLLNDLQSLHGMREEVKEKNDRLRRLEERLKELDSVQIQFRNLKRSLDLKSHELELLKKNMEMSNQYMLQKELSELEGELGSINDFLSSYPSRKKTLEGRVKEIERKMKHSKSTREQELKEAEMTVRKCHVKMELTRKEQSKKKQEVETLRLEIGDLSVSIKHYQKQVEELEGELERLHQLVREAESDLEQSRDGVKKITEKVVNQKKLLKGKSDEINRLHRKKEEKRKEIESRRIVIKKLEFEIEKIEKDSSDAGRMVKNLLKKHPWICEEKKDFGNESAGYPFKKTSFTIQSVEEKIERLKGRKAVLAKTVNMRANAMLADREKESEDVQKKREIVEDDKRKLIKYMKEVDEKKRLELENAYKVINKHFGSIFKALLPGTDAKLQPPAGKTIHDGLEVKVAFGDVWKESLTELSGGQRSLVALSLILALLRYNPAPIYILDEVDAALDQNHTTNIGHMIKTNFPNSQVISV